MPFGLVVYWLVAGGMDIFGGGEIEQLSIDRAKRMGLMEFPS